MTIPKPSKNETESEFMQRGTKLLLSEGVTSMEAAAICSAQWGKKMAMLKNINRKNESLNNNEIILK